MTTPTGTISLNDVNVELGLAGTTTISMNQTNVRTLAGVPSGPISMNDLRGKSNRVSISYTFSANTANASLNLSAIAGYVSGKSDITVTINSGVYLYSTSTGGYGLNLSGGTTGDTLTIVNNGYIMGMGGAGGQYNGGAFNGYAGGAAINFGFSLSSATINNTNASAYIGGGGGGGACAVTASSGGGGVGGGAGGLNPGAPGGTGGSVGASGGNGQVWFNPGDPDTYQGTGGGGGRVFPGVGGIGGQSGGSTSVYGRGGTGGGGGGCYYGGNVDGKAGGSGNSAGTTSTSIFSAGGGGGWGASGGNSIGSGGSTTTGGAGGKAVNLNGKTITWTSGNTTRVYGAVS